MIENRSTKRQRELLNFVDGFIKGHGYGPSYREIMRALGYKSVSTVAIHIDSLITKGYLHKRDNSARSLEVVSLQLVSLSSSKEPTTAQGKWIVDIINDKFNEYDKSGEEKLLDELYVLVGTLKILKLEEAHIAMRTRLMAIRHAIV